ncbi:MAG: polyprenyl synthetase family protein [Prevotellaceae bacterium]|jgi:geranylgeranyl diphosphate synthase type II|nr:polyprenyl synthetase family protein [Prevotellaceae bacterium]
MSKNFEDILQSINWNIEPLNLYKPIDYTLQSGGKRLRPMLVQFACRLFGKEPDWAENAAVAIEIFHNFTLLHDDIMDNSPMRRNKETVHRKWNANTAILSGDAMMIKSYEFLTKIPAKYWEKVFPLFTKTALEVCEGQQYDMDFEDLGSVSLEQYFEMIRLKTAVLLACSLKIGAIIADASEKDANLLYDFGIALGIAFQLKDDYLDAFGDEKLLGKRVGGDILCKKKTFLLLSAIERSKDDIKNLLQITIGSRFINDEKKISIITQIYKKLNIQKICEAELEKYYTLAINYLDKISVDKMNKSSLMDLSQKLLVRKN